MRKNLFKTESKTEFVVSEEQALRDAEMKAHLNPVEEFMEGDTIEKQQELETPALDYLDIAERLQNGKYDRAAFLKWKRHNSAEMDEIINNSKLLGRLLDSKADPESADGIIDNIRRLYGNVSEACRTYISGHEPKTLEGKARLDMVNKILERVTLDLRDFEMNAELYKRQQEGKNGDEGAEDVTWNDVLLAPHKMNVHLHGSVRISGDDLMTGSSEMVLLHEGDKKYFIKPKTYVAVADARAISALVLKKIQDEIREIEKGENGAFANLNEQTREQEIQKRLLKISAFNKIKDYILLEDPKDIGGLVNADKTYCNNVRKKHKVTPEEDAVLDELIMQLSTVALCAAMSESAKITPGEELNKRNEATSVMADVLGVSDIMMTCHRAEVNIDGRKIDGLRMDEVKGMPLRDALSVPEVLGKKVRYTPEAINSLIKMQVFDLICGQMDRNFGNFMVQTRIEGDTVVVDKVVGIDNDMAFGTLTYQEELAGKEGENPNASRKHKPMEDLKGNILLRGLDAEFAEKILALTPSVLEPLMGKLLSSEERAALADRLSGVQQAVLKMKAQNKLFTKKEQWEKMYNDMQEEYKAYAIEDQKLKEKGSNDIIRNRRKEVSEHMKEIYFTTYIDRQFVMDEPMTEYLYFYANAKRIRQENAQAAADQEISALMEDMFDEEHAEENESFHGMQVMFEDDKVEKTDNP